VSFLEWIRRLSNANLFWREDSLAGRKQRFWIPKPLRRKAFPPGQASLSKKEPILPGGRNTQLKGPSALPFSKPPSEVSVLPYRSKQGLSTFFFFFFVLFFPRFWNFPSEFEREKLMAAKNYIHQELKRSPLKPFASSIAVGPRPPAYHLVRPTVAEVFFPPPPPPPPPNFPPPPTIDPRPSGDPNRPTHFSASRQQPRFPEVPTTPSL